MKVQDFRFEKLEVYQRARRLLKEVYRITDTWPKRYLFDLSLQLRRATLSILLNIAEGSGRGKKDFARYLTDLNRVVQGV